MKNDFFGVSRLSEIFHLCILGLGLCTVQLHMFLKNKYGLFCGLLYRLSLFSVVLSPGCFSRPVVEEILVLFQNDSLRLCWAQGN